MAKKPKLLTRKKQIFGILLTIVCLIPAIVILSTGSDSVNWLHFYEFLSKMKKPFYLVPAVFSVLLSVFCEAFSLYFILCKMKAKTTISSSIVYATSDFYFSAITPSATGGQPASAYYMVKNKISASNATVALLLNVTLYVFTLLLLGGVAFLLQPQIILAANFKIRFLFFAAVILNTLLLLACVLFMVFPGPSRVIGRGVIRLLSALHIIKNCEKSEAAFKTYLAEYKAAFRTVIRYPSVLLVALCTNIMQRIFMFLVPFFVFLAIEGQSSLFDVMTSQALVTLTSNSVPLPGAAGISEYLFLSMTASYLLTPVRKPATLLFRMISHYFCFLACGIYTLAFHGSHIVKKHKKNGDSIDGSAK